MLITAPERSEYGEYYHRYVSRVPAGVNMPAHLTAQYTALGALLASIPDTRAQTRPAPTEWSINEVVGHLLDTERIFVYRALCVARGDTQPLPGMDQDPYVDHARFNTLPLADLLAEFWLLRQSTVWFVRSLDEVALTRTGTASGFPVSVRALVYMIAGHVEHHLESLRTVYLPPA
jgi:uncharacterized damage-inducible protein DinB